MKKSRIVLLIILIIVVSTCICFAATEAETQCADALYELGLFKGTGVKADGSPEYSLDSVPNRAEAITMLVRLLGKESEAISQEWEIPFNDVDAWARPYVGYAYNKGLTTGTGATTFGGSEKASETQYLTFVLRALGYSDKNGDFKWDEAKELTNKIGITYGKTNNIFLRGDVAAVSYFALKTEVKNSSTTLVESLCDAGVISESSKVRFVGNIITVQQLEKKNVNTFGDIPAETIEQKERFKLMMSYWNEYGLSTDSKGLTLTWDKARALVGKNILVVKDNVKTISDVLYYMCASGYCRYGNDLYVQDGDISWHFNRSPEVVFEENRGNCGGTAGLVAYLLENDYDEVGIAAYTANSGGGHVINYIKDGNVCYVFDVNQFAGGYGNKMNFNYGLDFKTTVYNALIKYESSNNRIKAMYTVAGRFDGDSPIGWTDDNTQYLIKDYYPNCTIIMETSEEGYVFKQVEITASVLEKIEELKKTKWITKKDIDRERNKQDIDFASLSNMLYLKIIGGTYDGFFLYKSGQIFGGGHDDWILEVYYGPNVVSDFELNINSGAQFGNVIKQEDGRVLCTNQIKNGNINFTISYCGKTISLIRKINGL